MIRHLTYQDIPTPLRAKSVGQARTRLQGVLRDPLASPEQRGAALREQGVLRDWAQGTLPLQGAQGPEQRTPAGESTPGNAHAVTVSEKLIISES